MADIPGQRKKASGYGTTQTVDVPLYQGKQGYQPQAAPTGIGQAVEGIAQNYLGVASVGAGISAQASQQLATMRAIEDAQKPGRKLLPAFTLADKQYEKIYHDEERANIFAAANRLSQKNFTLASQDQNLNADTLSAYAKETTQGLKQLVSSASDVNKPQLERAFEEQFLNNYYNLQNKLFAKELENNRQSFFIRGAEDNKEIESSIMDENPVNADILFNQRDKEIEDKLANGIIDKEEAYKQYFALNEAYLGGKLKKEAFDASKNKQDQEFLDNFDKRKDLSAAEKKQFGPQVIQVIKEYQAYHSGLQQINYAQARVMLAQNQLTPQGLEALAPGLSREGVLDLQYQLASQRQKVDKGQQALNYIQANPGSPTQFALLGSEDVNEAAQILWEQKRQDKAIALRDPNAQMGLQEKAQTLVGWPGKVGVLSQQISAAIKSGTPSQALDAIGAQNFIKDNNPWMFDHSDKDSKAISDRFQSKLAVNKDPDSALAEAQDEILNADSAKREDWKKQFTQQVDKQGWKEFDKQQKKIVQALGYGDAILGDGLTSVFMENLQSNFYGNWEQALKNTVDSAKTVWRVTDVNGVRQVMYKPLESLTALGPAALPAFKKQMRTELERLSFNSKLQFDDPKNYPDVQAYYEIAANAIEPLEVDIPFTGRANLGNKNGFPGLKEKGNIDLRKRGILHNEDGSLSTVDSFSVNIDGQEVLLPTITEKGKRISQDDAIKLYEKNGKHLGKFDTAREANVYAQRLHEQQEKYYSRNPYEIRMEDLVRENAGRIKINKIDRKGRVTEGYIWLENDNTTNNARLSDVPQYLLTMEVNGQRNPIMNAYTHQLYTAWSPDLEAIKADFEHRTKEELQYIEHAKESAARRKEIAKGGNALSVKGGL